MGRSPFLGPEPLRVAGDKGTRLEDAQSPVLAEALCPPPAGPARAESLSSEQSISQVCFFPPCLLLPLPLCCLRDK